MFCLYGNNCKNKTSKREIENHQKKLLSRSSKTVAQVNNFEIEKICSKTCSATSMGLLLRVPGLICKRLLPFISDIVPGLLFVNRGRIQEKEIDVIWASCRRHKRNYLTISIHGDFQIVMAATSFPSSKYLVSLLPNSTQMHKEEQTEKCVPSLAWHTVLNNYSRWYL